MIRREPGQMKVQRAFLGRILTRNFNFALGETEREKPIGPCFPRECSSIQLKFNITRAGRRQWFCNLSTLIKKCDQFPVGKRSAIETNLVDFTRKKVGGFDSSNHQPCCGIAETRVTHRPLGHLVPIHKKSSGVFTSLTDDGDVLPLTCADHPSR